VDAINARLCVVDQGHGIAAADLNHVFDAFWTTKVGGMGMGLALCESIVAAHHGRITAANSAGRGAIFCVSLPMGRVQ
jgi:signal transduction histidine kinase